jgi:molybdopterin/thiamine biosynthesis adenylyltransferase
MTNGERFRAVERALTSSSILHFLANFKSVLDRLSSLTTRSIRPAADVRDAIILRQTALIFACAADASLPGAKS